MNRMKIFMIVYKIEHHIIQQEVNQLNLGIVVELQVQVKPAIIIQFMIWI